MMSVNVPPKNNQQNAPQKALNFLEKIVGEEKKTEPAFLTKVRSLIEEKKNLYEAKKRKASAESDKVTVSSKPEVLAVAADILEHDGVRKFERKKDDRALFMPRGGESFKADVSDCESEDEIDNMQGAMGRKGVTGLHRSHTVATCVDEDKQTTDSSVSQMLRRRLWLGKTQSKSFDGEKVGEMGVNPAMEGEAACWYLPMFHY